MIQVKGTVYNLDFWLHGFDISRGASANQKKLGLGRPQTIFRFAASRTTYIETAAAADEIQIINRTYKLP